ncbi:hypothetical protein JCM17823_08460 [Halorubrum gandharaense]
MTDLNALVAGDDRAAPRGDERAVSVSVGYVLNLAVATLLLSGLFVAGGSFVQGEREAAIDGELTVVGERVAADLMTVDRLVANAEERSELVVERHVDLPPRVSGSQYRIAVESEEGATNGTVQLQDQRTDAVVEIPFRTDKKVNIQGGTVDGGDLTIRWDAEEGVVVVES